MASMRDIYAWRRENNERALDNLIPALEAKHGPEVALGEASRWSQIQHIDRLVAMGVDLDCRIGEQKVTPLMMAGTKAPAQRLLEHGADVNASDGKGRTALMWLFISLYRKNETLARVKLFLKHGADIAVLDQDGLSAYDHALEREDAACAELLRVSD